MIFRFSRTVLSCAAVVAIPLVAVTMVPARAQAQAVDGYKFLKAVEERDGTSVNQMISLPGTTLINTRDATSGRTAMHIVTQRRDLVWMNFLLTRGARVDAPDNKGVTALLIATQLRYIDGATLLLDKGADVNKGDGKGETPLMKAVMNRDLAMVRLLVARGANPDKTDSFSGSSARDLAKRDPRAAMILQAMSGAKAEKPKPVMGPGLK